ncbi:MAG: VWA domain-containing protein [Deltaproteobacteria bacterium]|nr:VWA domain-containing protein [Deltaproteobacteria bacterium]
MANFNRIFRNIWIKARFTMLFFIGAGLAISCSPETSKSGSASIYGVNGGSGNSGSSQPRGNDSLNGRTSGNNFATHTGTETRTTNENGLGEDICAGAHVQASRIKPRIMFIVDRSGSTADTYPGSESKWKAMYDALMDPEAGVIAKLQSVAYFGMVLYDGGEMDYIIGWVCFIPGMCGDGGVFSGDAGTDLGLCPRLVIIEPALNNHAAIDEKYRISGPGGSTPTRLALEAAYKLMGEDQGVVDQDAPGPQFAILCTDGLPNGCIDSFGLPDQQGPIDQVTAAANRGIKTYVIGVAATVDDTGSGGNAPVQGDPQAYLEELAKYGNTGYPAFSPATKEDLVAAISQIVGGAVGCKVKLNGTVVAGEECLGTVELNGKELECNGVDGWKLASESEIELQGTACELFMNNPSAIVSAEFPCDTFIIL